MAKFTTISSKEYEIRQIFYIYDKTTERLVYLKGGGYATTTDSVVTLQGLINLATLTDDRGGTVYFNPKAVESIQDVVAHTQLNLTNGKKFLVQETLTDVANKLTNADSSLIVREVITSSGQISSDTQIAIITTIGINVTLPNDRDRITVVNDSGGSATILPNGVNTIMNENDGLIGDEESWNLYLYSANWILT